ncbi:MAG: MotA/TolQ/ExbB proton channel family protein [Woeseiaceae bacterium]|nr:MotA/TolQ/ExbB proton channel family protein [Woeseiaceae bacterium]
MFNWTAYKEGFAALFEQGGMTLWAILFASILLWILIFERYWAHWRVLPQVRADLFSEWHRRKSMGAVQTFRRIEALVDDFRAEASRNLPALNALTTILPLLGLLGTVSGMIKVFDVITVFGTGNTRGMASGISEALVTTMAGLFTALAGLYFVSDLESRADEVARRFAAELVEDH